MIIDFFIVLLVFILVIYIPGFLLFCIIFKDKKDFSLVDLIPLSFVFGLVVFTLIGFLTYLLHFSHIFFFTLFSIAIAALLFTNIYLFITKKRDFVFEPVDHSIWITIIFIVLVLILILICFPSVYSGGDRWFHTGVMRRLAIDEPITPYFNLFKDVPNKIDAGYGYNIWHLAGSMIFRLSNINPNIIWEYLIIILAPLQLLSVGFLAKKINNNNLFYFLSLTIFFILAGLTQTGQEWRLSPYPDQIARNMMIPVILGLLLLFFRKEKIDKGILLGIVLSGITLLSIHLFSVIYFLIAISGMLIFSIFTDKKYQVFKKSLLILVVWSVLATPILYLNYLNNLQVVPTTSGSADWKTIAAGKYAIVNPEIWKVTWTYITASIAITVLLIWQFIKKRKVSLPILLCFVLTFFAAFLSFVPPVSNYIVKIITSTFLARLASIIPIYFIFALFIFEVVKNFKILSRAVIVIFIILLVFNVWQIKDGLLTIINSKSVRMNDAMIKDSEPYDYINKNIPNNAVIAASSQVSFKLFVFTNNHVVMFLPNNCPAIVDKKLRLKNLSQILDPNLAEQNSELYKKYQVDYILTQGGAVEGFKKQPKLFTEIHAFNDSVNQTIFKLNNSQ